MVKGCMQGQTLFRLCHIFLRKYFLKYYENLDNFFSDVAKMCLCVIQFCVSRVNKIKLVNLHCSESLTSLSVISRIFYDFLFDSNNAFIFWLFISHTHFVFVSDFIATSFKKTVECYNAALKVEN